MERLDFPPSILYENRYCNQDDNTVLFCVGKINNGKVVKSAFEILGPELRFNYLKYMPNASHDSKIFLVNSYLYVFDEYRQNGEFKSCVRKYCNKTKTWSSKTNSHIDYLNCSICSFKQTLYELRFNGSCFAHNYHENNRNELARMNTSRISPTCAVFEGKIIVTGGKNNDHTLKSIESYDYYENKWTNLPNMLEERNDHAAVSMGNKLFVIGGRYTTNCEVFDSFSRKFTEINSRIKFSVIKKWYFDAICIGKYIVVFQRFRYHTDTIIYLYDVCENKWFHIECEFTRDLFYSSFVKYYVQKNK